MYKNINYNFMSLNEWKSTVVQNGPPTSKWHYFSYNKLWNSECLVSGQRSFRSNPVDLPTDSNLYTQFPWESFLEEVCAVLVQSWRSGLHMLHTLLFCRICLGGDIIFWSFESKIYLLKVIIAIHLY